MLKTITLTAKQWSRPLAGVGHHINVVLAAGTIKCLLRQDDDSFQTDLVSGMAFRTNEQYSQAQFYSEISQTIKVWVGQLPLNYSPLDARVVGANALESRLAQTFFNEPSVLLPAQAGRGKVTISCLEDIYVGGVGLTKQNAIKVSAGVPFSISTQGAINAFTTSNAYVKSESAELTLPPEQGEVIPSSESTYHLLAYSKHNARIIFRQNGRIYSAEPNNITASKTQLISTSVSEHSVVHGDKLYSLGYTNKHTLYVIDLTTGQITSTGLMAAGVGNGTVSWNISATGDIAISNSYGGYKLYVGDINGVVEKALPSDMTAITGLVWAPSGDLLVHAANEMARSKNKGDSFLAKQAISVGTMSFQSMKVARNGVMIHAQTSDIYRSIDDGATWTKVADIAASGITELIHDISGQVFAIDDKDFYHSSNNGETFVKYADFFTGQSSPRTIMTASDGNVYFNRFDGNLVKLKANAVEVGGLPVAIMAEVN